MNFHLTVSKVGTDPISFRTSEVRYGLPIIQQSTKRYSNLLGFEISAQNIPKACLSIPGMFCGCKSEATVIAAGP
jgi:hypothetical protein